MPETDPPTDLVAYRAHATSGPSALRLELVRCAVGGVLGLHEHTSLVHLDPHRCQKNPVLAAEGAILLIDKVSGALENVDGSSGAIGNAVNGAVAAFVPIIAEAPADRETRVSDVS